MRRIPITFAAVIALMTAAPAVALGICVEGAYPPFSETRADGTVVGFDIDIANALCERIGETCEMVRTDWTRHDPGADRRALRRHHRLDVRHPRAAPSPSTSPTATTARRCASSGRRTPGSATRRMPSPARSWACSAARSTRPSCPRTTPPRCSSSTATRSTCCSTSRSAASTRCSARRCSSTRASSGRRPATGSPSSAATISTRRSRARRRDRRAQGGHRPARPALGRHRRDPRRRHLRRDRGRATSTSTSTAS